VPVRIAVTGAPGCGKTTLIRRVAETIKKTKRVGGIYTEEIREGGVRVGFAIADIATGKRGTLASIDPGSGPRVGKYRVSLEGIEEVALPAIAAAARDAEIIAIDEIAPMECASPRFVEAVQTLLDTAKPLIVALHRNVRGPLFDRIRREFEIHTVTTANRDGLVETLAERLLGK
jgi:nucleoside-triphosphatase